MLSRVEYRECQHSLEYIARDGYRQCRQDCAAYAQDGIKHTVNLGVHSPHFLARVNPPLRQVLNRGLYARYSFSVVCHNSPKVQCKLECLFMELHLRNVQVSIDFSHPRAVFVPRSLHPVGCVA